jgi:hypothetical protein
VQKRYSRGALVRFDPLLRLDRLKSQHFEPGQELGKHVWFLVSKIGSLSRVWW